MFFVYFAAAWVILLGGVYAIFFGDKNPPLKTVSLRLGNTSIIAEVADTTMSRARGLSGRDSLEAGHGMLFTFSQAGMYGFWMNRMRFPLDIVWIREGKVVGVSSNVPNQPSFSPAQLKLYYPPQEADTVLELNAGTATAAGIAPGVAVILSKG